MNKAEKYKSFLKPKSPTELIHSNPNERRVEETVFNDPRLIQIAEEEGIKLPIKIPDQMKPHLNKSDPRLIEED